MKPKPHHKWQGPVFPVRASVRSKLSFPFADNNLGSTSRSRIDGEFVNQPFGARQAESQGLRCAEASGERAIEISNSRAVIKKLEFKSDSLSTAQDPDASHSFL